MKKIFVAMICCLLFMEIGCPVLAAQNITVGEASEVVAILPDDYSVLTVSNIAANEETIQKFGKTTDEMMELFNSSGFLFYAVSSDYTSQIYLIQEESNVSKAIVNLGELEGDALENAKKCLISNLSESSNSSEPEIFRKDSILYYRVIKSSVEEDGQVSVYYLTVVNSKSYVLCYVKEKGGLLESDNTIINSVAQNLEIKSGEESKDALTNVNSEENTTSLKASVNAALIIIAAIFAIVLIISIVRELRRKQLDSDYYKKAPRKPRR